MTNSRAATSLRLTRHHLAIFLIGMMLIHLWLLRQGWQGIRIGLPDFSIFYTAGKIVRSGQAARLYDNALQESVQSEFAAEGIARRGSILPYNHLPFEALLFVPLTAVSYRAAYFIWFAINIAILMAIALMLRRDLEQLRTFPPWLLILAPLAFLPIFIALMQGQDSIVLLLVYVMAFRALRSGSEFSAGAWLGLGLCKYHLLLPFLLVFLWQRRTRLIAGFVVVAFVLGVISFALVGWDGLRSYPGYVLHSEQNKRYVWNASRNNTPNLRSLLIGVWPGHQSEEDKEDSLSFRAVLALTSLLLLAATIRGWLRKGGFGSPAFQFAFALNLLATLLLSYHSFLHDMSMLFLTILLVGNSLAAVPGVTRGLRNVLLVCSALLFLSPLMLILTYMRRLWLINFVLVVFFVALYRASQMLKSVEQ
jgi:glycosyl transferase family 87